MKDIFEAAGLNDIFQDFMGLFGFGSYKEPPPEIPLRILGLVPVASQREIRKAFRAKVIEAHPDMKAAFDNPALQDIAQKHRKDLPEIRELIWARDCALMQAPKPVTTTGDRTASHPATVTRPQREYFTTEIGAEYVCRLCGAALCPPARIRHRYDSVSCFYCETCFQEKNTQRYPDSSVRRCVVCGVGMSVRRPGCYCSDQCRNKAYRDQRRERRAWRRENTPCQTCGERFTPARSDAKYCSAACRQRAYRLR